jgi:uncharacterized protein (DUF983 family)
MDSHEPEKVPTWFTCHCPYCSLKLRLLKKMRDRKVMCPDCSKPFVAQPSDETIIEVPGEFDHVPPRGWLIVCPACSQTEVVSDDVSRRSHCSGCGSELPVPIAASKWLKKKQS